MNDSKPLSLKDRFATHSPEDRLLEAVNEAEKGNNIAFYIINICDLPQNSYSWLMMLKKRYSCFNDFCITVLEAHVTAMDFESTRHFRSWFVASLKGKQEEINNTPDGVIDLDMWKNG